MLTALVLEPNKTGMPSVMQTLSHSILCKRFCISLPKALVEIVTWKWINYLELSNEDCSAFPSRMELGYL